MIRLQFALWRRDVAIRKLAKLRKVRWRSDRWANREVVLDQRMRRWERIARSFEGEPA